MEHTIWEKTSLPQFPPLRGEVRTDVLVIGGGLTGLLCARLLTDAGVDTVLVEANRLCGGTTGHTTAKVTLQHGAVYHKLLRTLGKERTQMYLAANAAALEQYRDFCCRIDCGFTEQDAYVYARRRSDKLHRELAALEELGVAAEFEPCLPLPFPTAGAIRLEGQAAFDPLRFAAGILTGLRIYEGTAVRELVGLEAVTDTGRIRAKKIVVATHFPFLNKHGSYFLKLYQQRSYVLALEGAADVQGMYLGVEENGLSFRNAEGLLLLGGGGHRTGRRGGGWTALTAAAKRYYPDARICCRWAAQDCMTLDGAPYIGPYSARTEGVFVATGFNKWGMTSAMAAAMILRDLVQGRENPWAAAFSPERSILRPQLAVNGLEAVRSLVTPAGPRCPHMGCALKWNAAERSWDCPCHGSRFSERGALLDGPATGDLPRKKDGEG